MMKQLFVSKSRGRQRKLGAAVVFLLSAWMEPSAWAATTLKQVQISNGSQIDLLFDGKVSKSQIRTEFFGNVIQLSLEGVSVYPAKISSVNGSVLAKVFAYQYAPKLVRCRLSVKGSAESYKRGFQVVPNSQDGKILTIRLGPADGIPVSSSAGLKGRPKDRPKNRPKNRIDTIAESAALEEPEEKALLQKVIQESPPGSAGVNVSAAIAGSPEPSSLERSAPIAGGKPLPSPIQAFGKLMVVIGVFGALALAVKKLLARRAASSSQVIGAISRFARNSLGKSPKMVDVLSNHYLGPKKSIAVVKIASRVLVLGVTQEAINLITEFESEAELEASGALAGELATALSPTASKRFSEMFTAEASRPSSSSRPQAGAQSRPAPGVAAYQSNPGATSVTLPSTEPIVAPQEGIRSRIKSRLEGLKQL